MTPAENTAFDENHGFCDVRVSVIFYCPYLYGVLSYMAVTATAELVSSLSVVELLLLYL